MIWMMLRRCYESEREWNKVFYFADMVALLNDVDEIV